VAPSRGRRHSAGAHWAGTVRHKADRAKRPRRPAPHAGAVGRQKTYILRTLARFRARRRPEVRRSNCSARPEVPQEISTCRCHKRAALAGEASAPRKIAVWQQVTGGRERLPAAGRKEDGKEGDREESEDL